MKHFKKFLSDMFRVWKNEFRLVIRDQGILIFLYLVPLLYPIVYALIYNPEMSRDVPVAVVDQSRSAKSRELARLIDASEGASVAGYTADMGEARRMMAEKKCYGIVLIDNHFEEKIGRGEQAVVTLYMDMSLLIRYKSMLLALTDATLQLGSQIQFETLASLGALGPSLPETVESAYFPLGNPEQGFATFLLPGILVLIVQQTVVLAVCMAGGASYERRRRFGGIDPLDCPGTGSVSRMLGKAVAYIMLYVGPLVYIVYFVPMIFKYPQTGSLIDILLLCVPYMLAVVFFGMTLQMLVRERESSFLVIVFTSLIFLFLSGIPWPLYDMSPFYQLISACCPSTWAMQAFVRINANGATLDNVSHEYTMLWVCAAVYFLIALAADRLSHTRQHR